MKAKLKSWYCPDIDDLSNYSPPQFDNFCMLFTVMVGPAEEEGYESFDIQVCTPKWLEFNIKKNGFICGRHFLIVLEFEYESIINKIRNLIESCEGKNWDEIAKKVSRIGYWEFEDYHENIPGEASPGGQKIKKELSVNFETGFADSTIKSYSVDGENLKLFLECWNSEIVEIKFLEFVSLFAMNHFRIANLLEVFESPLLEKVLIELYEKKPEEHDFRIFKFLNSDDMTALEIVCKDIEIKKV